MFPKIRKYCRKPFVFVYSRLTSPAISGAHYGVISEDPPLVNFPVSCPSEQGYRKCIQRVMPLFDCLRMHTTYFLCTWWWHHEYDNQAEIVKRFEAAHSRKYPNHHFIHLCNTPKQETVFREKGLQAEFINHNCLVDERIFKPLPNVKKVYHAVYDARLKKYKRHHLAQNLQSSSSDF